MAEAILSPGVFQNETDQSLVQRGIVGSATAIVGPTVMGQPYIPTYVTSYSEYVAKFGETFKSGSYYYEYLTSLAAKDFFQNGGQTLLVTRIISGSANYSTYASSSVGDFAAAADSFELEVLAWGDQMNNSGSEVSGALPNGTATNVRWEIINVQTGSGTFSLGIRAGNDNNAQKNYLETWPNLSLDPMLPNFISRVIGDLKPVYDAINNVINYTGSYANASQFVRVKSVIGLQPDSYDNNGAYKATQYSGSLPAVGSGSFNGGVAATGATQNMGETISSSNIQGFSGADYVEAFQLLANKDEFQFNVLLAPGLTLDTTGNAVSTMISTCESRGDAIAIVDTKLYGSNVASAATAAQGQSSNYAATYYPWIQLYSSGLGKAVWAPASTVIGGVFAFNDQVGAEWFAPAGLNRGGVPAVLRAERKLSQADRDTLYEANVNPLATFPGEGVVVFGQKTLQKKQTALDRVNVRRLLIALKNYIGQVGNNLVFEQNTNVTRNRFLSQVNPYLESVVQRQGLYAYKVVMDDSNNTPDVIDRNQLVGQIYIQPTKTAEFIILNFNVQPTGASFPA
jgi:hypothetical protein